jgi:catechol 2,3-dioxygenase-like lactoylglutathione lyase family enzyme
LHNHREFQVKPDTDLGELSAQLGKEGIKSEVRPDISPGVRKAVVFTDPKGTPIEIYADYAFAPAGDNVVGISPNKFGHVAYRVKDVQKVTQFYCDFLGFRVSDWIGDHFSFPQCGVCHHTMNFVQYDQEAMHHIAKKFSLFGDRCVTRSATTSRLIIGTQTTFVWRSSPSWT